MPWFFLIAFSSEKGIASGFSHDAYQILNLSYRTDF